VKKVRDERSFVVGCLITYNHGAFIQKAIESAQAQQVDFPIEFIIADDCSTDGTTDIIRKMAASNPGIRPLLREKNIGAGPNFISMLQAAKGKYIAYLEGDDYWTDNRKLQKQVDFLERHPDYSICFHQVRLIDKGNLEKETVTKATRDVFGFEDVLNRDVSIATGSMVFRRKEYDHLPAFFRLTGALFYTVATTEDKIPA